MMNILEDFVQGRAHMDVTVGVWRSIVEDELGTPLGGLTHLGIELIRLPFFELFGFTLRQVGLHREGGGRQVKRLFIVHGFLRILSHLLNRHL
jgi:hypothetical protein